MLRNTTFNAQALNCNLLYKCIGDLVVLNAKEEGEVGDRSQSV